MDYVPVRLRIRGATSARSYNKSVRGQIYSSFIQYANNSVAAVTKLNEAAENVASTSGTQRVKRKVVLKKPSDEQEIVPTIVSDDSVTVTVDSPPTANTMPIVCANTLATTLSMPISAPTMAANPLYRAEPIFTTTHPMSHMPMAMAPTIMTPSMMPMYGNTYSYMPYTSGQLMPNYSVPSQSSVGIVQPINHQ